MPNNDLDPIFVAYGERLGRQMVKDHLAGKDPYVSGAAYGVYLSRVNRAIEAESSDMVDRNFRTGDFNIGVNSVLASKDLKLVRISRA